MDNYLLGTPVEQDFYRKTGGITNGFIVVAASGRLVGEVKDWDVKKFYTAFMRMPESDRKPVLEKDLGTPNPMQMPPTKPVGATTFIIYNTPLDRDVQGKLVRARRLRAPGPSWPLEAPITLNDLFQLTREESRSLMPDQPDVGQSGMIPESAQRRLFMFNGYDWSLSYQNDVLPLRSGDLRWTVEKASETEIRLRLDGYSQVGGAPDALQHCRCNDVNGCVHWGTDLKYRGHAVISRANRTIQELQLVGLGETRTRYNRWKSTFDSKVNVYPTGLVVELASDCPANRNGWHPRAPERMLHAGIDYWNPKPKPKP